MSRDQTKRLMQKAVLIDPPRVIKAFVLDDGQGVGDGPSLCFSFKTLHEPTQRLRLSQEAFLMMSHMGASLLPKQSLVDGLAMIEKSRADGHKRLAARGKKTEGAS